MPYVPGADAHGVTHVSDVYRSSNVFVNNVPVALWQPPGQSAAFANMVPASPVELLPEAAVIATNTEAYVSNPNAYANANAEANGVKRNFKPVEVTASASSEAPDAPAGEIAPFLKNILDEAAKGMWRESGQGGKPSNPNIVNIWKELGFPQSGPWMTDQTPWCAGFVNWILKRTGYRWAKEAGAYTFENKPERWNSKSVPINLAQPGDIVVWNFGHVNMVYTANNGKYSFVGGNQTPSSGKNNNPSDGDATVSWPSGWTAAKGGIKSIWRPSRT